jgi:zinc transport system substrate-binding protein
VVSVYGGEGDDTVKRFLTLLVVPLFVACSALAAGADTLKVVAGTSLVEDIVLDLTSGRVTMVTITPGSSCPGHTDLKATDVAFAASADVALVHQFQMNMPQVKTILAAANKNLRVETLSIQGNWTIPPIQEEATRRISQILTAIRPHWAADIQRRTAARLGRIAAAKAQAEKRLAPLAGKSILAAAMQADFLRWAGLRVVKEYGRTEDMTPRDLVGLMEAARGKNVVGVVDNLQSGADAGRPLAEELRVPHIVLSNFPGSLPGTEDYFGLLNHNVRLLSGLAVP